VVLGGAGEMAVNFVAFESACAYLSGGRPSSEAPLGVVAAAGAAAGVPISLVLSPVELIKIRAQTATDPSRATALGALRAGLARAAERARSGSAAGGAGGGGGSAGPGGGRGAGRPRGPRSAGVVEAARFLSTGLPATLAREVPGNLVFFAAYEATRRALVGRSGSPASDGGGGGLVTALIAGGASGAAMWSVVLPLDSAKTLHQAAPDGEGGGLVHRLRQIVREGRAAAGGRARGAARGLWAGFAPVVLRALPVNAVLWSTWAVGMAALTPREGRG